MTVSPSQVPRQAPISPRSNERRHLRRPTVNITPAERVGRVGVGAAGAIAGIRPLPAVQVARSYPCVLAEASDEPR